MVSQVLPFQTLDLLVVLHRDARPLLVDQVRQDGELIAGIDFMIRPVVGQLVASFLPAQAAFDRFLTSVLLLKERAGAVDSQRGIGDLLLSLVAHFGQP